MGKLVLFTLQKKDFDFLFVCLLYEKMSMLLLLPKQHEMYPVKYVQIMYAFL